MALGSVLVLFSGIVESNSNARNSCATIQWNPEFLAAYPKAAAACRQVVLKDGIEFAEFDGTISKVNHDVVQVEVSDVVGMPLATITFLMGRDGRVVVDATGKTVNRLTPGDHLKFWIREGSFGLSPTLKDRPMFIAVPARVEQLIENLGLPEHFIELR